MAVQLAPSTSILTTKSSKVGKNHRRNQVAVELTETTRVPLAAAKARRKPMVSAKCPT
jgi:hypothetical protein